MVEPTTTTEPIDYGFRTTVAIEKLEERLADPNCRTDTVLINIATMLRNRARKDVRSDILVDEVRQDIIVSVNKLIPLMHRRAQGVVPSIILYVGDYFHAIPEDYRRTAPPSKATYMTAWVFMYKSPVMGTQHINGVDIVEARLRPMPKIYEGLAEVVRKQKTTHNLVMLSHVVCDYHIQKWFPHLELVNSATGTFVPAKDFATKVFGSEIVPFYPFTHAVLGDKELITCSLDIKQKREMYRIAEEEKWQYKTEQFVKEAMQKHGFLVKGRKYPFN